MQRPTKRRRTEPILIEEINFDSANRQEYLTGFHKRKLQRAKHAREAAERKARADRIEDRKRLREERKANLERHVQEVNALLNPVTKTESEAEDSESLGKERGWEGVVEPAEVDHEAEYVDEDRYTTVTVEAMDITREGLNKFEDSTPRKEGEGANGIEESKRLESRPVSKRKWTKEKPKDEDKRDHHKKKKKNFRYESKAERRFTRVKEKMKNSKQASARREK